MQNRSVWEIMACTCNNDDMYVAQYMKLKFKSCPIQTEPHLNDTIVITVAQLARVQSERLPRRVESVLDYLSLMN